MTRSNEEASLVMVRETVTWRQAPSVARGALADVEAVALFHCLMTSLTVPVPVFALIQALAV
jgi:hypothetical protein